MSKIINVSLNTASINAAVQELRNYAKWVAGKTAELQERIATLIANDARIVYNNSIADDLLSESPIIGNVRVVVQTNGNVTVVIADGKDAVFMEFGAGVFYNGAVGSSPNPWGNELGLTIGSFGKGNGAKQVWGYRGDDGEIHLTHGAPASMPLYRAVQSVSRDIERIAREVFST